MRSIVLVCLLLLGASVSAMADTVITLDSKGGTTVTRQTMYLAENGFRMEGPSTFTLYRSDQNVLFDVTPSRLRYTRITAERLRQAASDFDAARGDWGDRLRTMSDERRKHMEAALGPATANSKSPLVFTPTEFSATSGNWHCKMLHVMLEGVQHGSVCVVPLAELQLNGADVQILRRLTAFMLQGPHPPLGLAAFWDLAAIEAAAGEPGLPVETIIATPGGWFEYTVRAVEKRSTTANNFTLPEGLTEETMPPRPGG